MARKQVQFYIDTEKLELIDEMARIDRRSRSSQIDYMLSVLLDAGSQSDQMDSMVNTLLSAAERPALKILKFDSAIERRG